MKKVAVIIPCLNGERYLSQCLNSVFSQDYSDPIEVIIADDGCTDSSEKISREYAQRVTWLPCPQGAVNGCGAARNRAIKSTDAEYLAFLDADDIWFPVHLQNLVSALDSNEELAFCCDNGRYVDEFDKIFGNIVPDNWITDLTPESMLLNCFTDPSGVVVRRSALDIVDGFAQSQELLYVEDHDLWLRLLERFRGKYIPTYGYGYRLHSSQVSWNPKMWRNAYNVLEIAKARYPYPKSVLRKRNAVLHYRTSQVAYRQGQFAKAASFLTLAALLDPSRAFKEAYQRIR